MAHVVKLQQPERPRTRVRDLARDIGVHHSQVLEFLRSSGEFVRSELSFLEAPSVRRVREHFGVPDVDDRAGNARRSAETPPPTAARGLGAPATRSRRENNPFIGSLSIFTSTPAMSLAPPNTPPPQASAGADYSAAGAFEPAETWRDLEWAIRGLSEVERDGWLAHGLEPRHARVAAACKAADMLPADLTRDVYGWTVLYRVTHGEDPSEVRRLMDRAQNERASS